MDDIDYDKIADMVANKLKEKRQHRSDEDFAMMLAEKLQEHRSPCHGLKLDDIEDIKDLIKRAKRFRRGFAAFWLMFLGLVAKSMYEKLSSHFHW